MPAPILPNQILETVASLDGDFCEKFVGSLRSPALFEQWYKSVFLEDGTLTDEFKAMVCEGTVGTGGDPVDPPVEPPVVPPVDPPVIPPAPTPLAAPTLRASTTFAQVIQLYWNQIAGAGSYHIYRDGAFFVQAAGNATLFNDFSVGPATSHTYTIIAQPANPVVNTQSAASNVAYGATRPIFGF